MSEEETPSEAPQFDMSIYDKLEADFDAKLASIGEGSSPEELDMTTPHDNAKVNDDVKRLIAAAKESSAAYYKELLSLGKAGASLLLAAQ